LPFFCQNCSLPFSLRSLDIPALLKSWQKHYFSLRTIALHSTPMIRLGSPSYIKLSTKQAHKYQYDTGQLSMFEQSNASVSSTNWVQRSNPFNKTKYLFERSVPQSPPSATSLRRSAFAMIRDTRSVASMISLDYRQIAP
jgi:hypothetical protein